MNRRTIGLPASVMAVAAVIVLPWLVSLRTPTALASPPLPPLATVTAVTSEQPAIKASSSAGVSFTADPYRTYTLIHTGVDAAGAASTQLVCIGINAAPAAADWTEDNNKFPLPSGSAVVVGPFAGVIYLKSASGAPMISILPSAQNKGL